MATSIQRWLAKDGKEFRTEIEADAHDTWCTLCRTHYEVQKASEHASGTVYNVMMIILTKYRLVPIANETPSK